MAEFLTTTGISFRLEGIIKSATERLVIISPFLKVNERIKELLEDKGRLKIDIRVIYGKNELQPGRKQLARIDDFDKDKLLQKSSRECYLNENEALLTSMNLYEFSQQNNNEMGIIVSREIEPELYNQIWEESKRIVRLSEEIRVTVARLKQPKTTKGIRMR